MKVRRVGLRAARTAAHGIGAALPPLNGFETYCPRLREQRRSHGRKIVRTPPLFPGYAFVMILSGWWNARWSPGASCRSRAG